MSVTHDRSQPVQLRIGFSRPTRPATITLSLAGLTVLADSPDASFEEVWQHLLAAGVAVSVAEGRGIAFAVDQLARLVELAPHVQISCDELLAPLWALARNPSADGVPATLTVDSGGVCRLGWFDGTHNYDVAFDPQAAAALLASELSFVATADAWDVLKRSCTLPVLAGRARVNLDGFVEIRTSKPQLVESAPLPGLFRVSDTVFGLALAFAPTLDTEGGFVWEGRKPVLDQGPARLPTLPIRLSAHAEADLAGIVAQLAAFRAQAVVWDAGLGRRVFCLAALEALDAWPLLIVTPPSAVWVWQRHLDLIGRSYSLTHDRADAHLITYLDLAHRRHLPAPQAVVFDSLAGPEASTEVAARAVRRLDGFADAYRISIDSSWPEDLADQVALMGVLRPGEFRADVPLAQRYPGWPERRAGEHVGVYLSVRRRESASASEADGFRHSGVRTVNLTDAQDEAIAELGRRLAGAHPAQVLAELLEVVSAGPAHAVSPKVGAAAQLAQAALAAGRRVALVTRHRRSATLLTNMLRPRRAVIVEEPDRAPADAEAVIVRFERAICDLRGFDEVVVVDYPWSSATLERAVGSAADEHGPARVTVVHAVGSVDDRIAMLAARRRELAAVIDAAGPPTPDEIAYLLARRLD